MPDEDDTDLMPLGVEVLGAGIVADEDIKERYCSYGDAPDYTKLKKDGNDNFTKCYEDLNAHIVTECGNDGKTATTKLIYNGKDYVLSGLVSGNEVVFEKVIENYIMGTSKNSSDGGVGEGDNENQQFGDPLDYMQIVHNRASNLFGKVRSRFKAGKLHVNDRDHQGFDYYAEVGTPIMAVADGQVREIQAAHKDYGKTLTIRLDNSKYDAYYAHLSKIREDIVEDFNKTPRIYTRVKKGEKLGETGITGNATDKVGDEQHLHFECRDRIGPWGFGTSGRESPNEIVTTKFYSQNETKKQNGDYAVSQTITGVKKVGSDGTEILMEVKK